MCLFSAGTPDDGPRLLSAPSQKFLVYALNVTHLYFDMHIILYINNIYIYIYIYTHTHTHTPAYITTVVLFISVHSGR